MSTFAINLRTAQVEFDYRESDNLNNLNNQNNQKNMCRYYNTPRGCNLGSKCSFAHIQEKPKKTRLCRYYDSPKGCNLGSKCGFAHGRDELDISAERECKFGTECQFSGCPYTHPQKMCRDWEAFGTCKNSKDCKFLHRERVEKVQVKTELKEVGVKGEIQKPVIEEKVIVIEEKENVPKAKLDWNKVVETVFEGVEKPKSSSWADEMEEISEEDCYLDDFEYMSTAYSISTKDIEGIDTVDSYENSDKEEEDGYEKLEKKILQEMIEENDFSDENVEQSNSSEECEKKDTISKDINEMNERLYGHMGVIKTKLYPGISMAITRDKMLHTMPYSEQDDIETKKLKVLESILVELRILNSKQ